MPHLALLYLHITLVACSIALFASRGIGVAMRQDWPMRAGVRRLSVVLDSALLTAGIALWVIAQHNPLVEAWLACKLIGLVFYIVLGSFALKRGRTRLSRLLWLVAALAVVTQMIGIAHMRHPLGWWVWLTNQS